MPKMKYRTKDGEEFEFDGEELEIQRLLQMVKNIFSQPRVDMSVVIEEIKPSMPSDKDVEAYIKSKTNYEHTTFEIQKHFFGKRFSSRDPAEKSTYHRINKQLRKIRKKIQKEESGKFKEEFIKGGLKRYTFKKEVIPTISINEN